MHTNSRGLPLFALLAVFGGCAVQAEYAADFRVSKTDTWAWLAEPELQARDENADLLAAELKRALEGEMQARGVRRAAAPSEARFLMRATVEVHVKQLGPDDWDVALYEGRVVEEAFLTVTLQDGASGDEVWKATMVSKLREKARTMGGAAARMTPTRDKRDWQLPKMAQRVVGTLPVE